MINHSLHIFSTCLGSVFWICHCSYCPPLPTLLKPKMEEMLIFLFICICIFDHIQMWSEWSEHNSQCVKISFEPGSSRLLPHVVSGSFSLSHLFLAFSLGINLWKMYIFLQSCYVAFMSITVLSAIQIKLNSAECIWPLTC